MRSARGSAGPCGGRSVAPQAVFAARMSPARLRPAKRSRVDRRHCPVGQNSANDHGDDSVQSSACCPGQLPLSCMRCDSFHVGLISGSSATREPQFLLRQVMKRGPQLRELPFDAGCGPALNPLTSRNKYASDFL